MKEQNNDRAMSTAVEEKYTDRADGRKAVVMNVMDKITRHEDVSPEELEHLQWFLSMKQDLRLQDALARKHQLKDE